MEMHKQLLYFATHNTNKVNEVKDILGYEWKIVSLQDLDIKTPIPETGSTLDENARIKADWLYHFLQKGNCFAEDTGLEVEALLGEPGVYTARYAGKHATADQNITRLLNDMRDIKDRRARFRTIMGLWWQEQYFEFEGIVKGTIALEPSGGSGFGYDPVFIPEGYDKTFAQLGPHFKKEISHRAQALRNLVRFIQSQH